MMKTKSREMKAVDLQEAIHQEWLQMYTTLFLREVAQKRRLVRHLGTPGTINGFYCHRKFQKSKPLNRKYKSSMYKIRFQKTKRF